MELKLVHSYNEPLTQKGVIGYCINIDQFTTYSGFTKLITKHVNKVHGVA